MLFGPVSSGALVIGNMIANVKAIDGKNGIGIYLAGPEAPRLSRNLQPHNQWKRDQELRGICEGSAIGNGGLNDDIVISGNVIQNTNSVVPAAAISLTDATRILITGNNRYRSAGVLRWLRIIPEITLLAIFLIHGLSKAAR
jgi:hypothetical protein